ncbi:hypothetical protein Tco_1214728, partial [Tanacetum coccineum]
MPKKMRSSWKKKNMKASFSNPTAGRFKKLAFIFFFFLAALLFFRMLIVRVICEEFVDLKLAIRQDLGFIPSGNVVLSSTYVGKILGADQLLVILCYRYQESGIGYWILSMTISGSGVTFLPSEHHEFYLAGYDRLVSKPSKTGGSWKDNKKAKRGTGFVATASFRNEVASSTP